MYKKKTEIRKMLNILIRFFVQGYLKVNRGKILNDLLAVVQTKLDQFQGSLDFNKFAMIIQAIDKYIYTKIHHTWRPPVMVSMWLANGDRLKFIYQNAPPVSSITSGSGAGASNPKKTRRKVVLPKKQMVLQNKTKKQNISAENANLFSNSNNNNANLFSNSNNNQVKLPSKTNNVTLFSNNNNNLQQPQHPTMQQTPDGFALTTLLQNPKINDVKLMNMVKDKYGLKKVQALKLVMAARRELANKSNKSKNKTKKRIVPDHRNEEIAQLKAQLAQLQEQQAQTVGKQNNNNNNNNNNYDPMMEGENAVIGAAIAEGVLLPLSQRIVQGASCTYNWLGNMHRNWRYWRGGYGKPVEQRPGFTNEDLYLGVPATFDANGNETTNPRMLVGANDGVRRPQPEMIVCRAPRTTVHQLSILYQVMDILNESGVLAPPAGVHTFTHCIIQPQQLKKRIICMASQGASPNEMRIVTQNRPESDVPLNAYPFDLRERQYIAGRMEKIMVDIIDSPGIIWEIDRGNGKEAYFTTIGRRGNEEVIDKRMLQYGDNVLIRIVINMIVYSDWHRKFVDVGLRSRKEHSWRICAADLGLLCCLVMKPDGVFENYPQLRITWLIGMVEATIEAYRGRGRRGMTIMELLRGDAATLLDDAATGQINISCGTGAAERMLKEINDSLHKLIKERIFSEEGMKVHRLRKLRELQRQYAEDSANHDFLNADINNIQNNGVIKRRRGKDAEKPLGDEKRMDQVKVFAQRLYQSLPNITDSRESIAQFKKEILKMATEFPSGDTEAEWKRDILEYIIGGGKFLEDMLYADQAIITAFENAPWNDGGGVGKKQGGSRKRRRRKKTRKRKKKSHKKTRKGRKKKNRK